MDIRFLIDTLRLKGGTNRVENKKLLYLLEALVNINILWLRENPGTPSIYDGGVVYKPEIGAEDWKDIPHILADGFGDCEDLAAARVAELRRQGIRAKVVLRDRYIPRARLTVIHVLVRHPNGRLEDPSKKLGMKGAY